MQLSALREWSVEVKFSVLGHLLPLWCEVHRCQDNLVPYAMFPTLYLSGYFTVMVTVHVSMFLQDNGHETCVVEAQAVGSNCLSGGCKQTCTVTPIKVENCAGDESANCATQASK